MKVGDWVRHKGIPDSIPCQILEIINLGHGKGKERVQIQLPVLGLVRYYAKDELEGIRMKEKAIWIIKKMLIKLKKFLIVVW